MNVRSAGLDEPIRVLIVNDSATSRAALRAAFAHERGILVVHEASSGSEAVAAAASSEADVVLMDIVMPDVDGYAATRAIMESRPVGIILVSAVRSPRDANVALEALRAGALAVTELLPSPLDASYEVRRQGLVSLVRSAARARVRKLGALVSSSPAPVRLTKKPPYDVCGIVASAGGPAVLVDLLGRLGREFPPVLIVQHLGKGFMTSFAHWIQTATGLPTVLAQPGDQLRRGTVYLPQEDRHLGVDERRRICIQDDAPVDGFRPSGSFLLRTLAKSHGSRALGIILTGMGRDGAAGASALRRAGGTVLVQSEESCIVFGMPRVAIELGAADEALAPLAMVDWIR